MGLLINKKGLSPVVASLILCSIVLVVGISTWSFAYSATSALQTNYYEGVQEQIDKISERFTVEHVAYIDGSLHIWVCNYGDVDIEVIQVIATGDAEGANNTVIPITHGKMVKIEMTLNAGEGNELSITVMSRRNNFAYATYAIK